MRGSKLDKTMLESKVFDYIQKFTAQNGFAPAIRDICKGCEIRSTATVYYIINSLCDKGLLHKSGKNMRRAVGLTSSSVVAPAIGYIAPGKSVFAVENYEDFFAIPSNYFAGDDLYVFTVSGDSMINTGMFNGDKIVVQKQDYAEDGDIVAAMIDGTITVKRYFERDGKIVLHPENDDMDDFIYDDVTIIGKVVGLMRSY